MTIVLIILALVFLIIEATSYALVSIWFAVGFFVAAIVSLFTDNIYIITISGVLTTSLTIAFLRTYFLQKLNKKANDDISGVRKYIGRRVFVDTPWEKKGEKYGEIKLDGTVWNFKSDVDKIEIGTEVVIIDIIDSKIIVKPFEEDK